MLWLALTIGLLQSPQDIDRLQSGWSQPDPLAARAAENPNFWKTLRDPFARYLDVAACQGPDCKGIQEAPKLRVIALITGTANPKAMVVDDRGVGHVLLHGQIFGSPPQRVDRITRNEVVLRALEGAYASGDTLSLVLDPRAAL